MRRELRRAVGRSFGGVAGVGSHRGEVAEGRVGVSRILGVDGGGFLHAWLGFVGFHLVLFDLLIEEEEGSSEEEKRKWKRVMVGTGQGRPTTSL